LPIALKARASLALVSQALAGVIYTDAHFLVRGRGDGGSWVSAGSGSGDDPDDGLTFNVSNVGFT